MDKHQRREIAHLLRRAGFGCTPADIDTYAALGYEGAVDRLVNYEAVDDGDAERLAAAVRAAGPPYARPDRPELGNLELEIAVWLTRMLHTRRPLQEKMTLFWHGHFVSSDAKVTNSALMLRQNELFRSNALTANFKGFTKSVAHDPAMLVYLDNYMNRAGAPNENWARELMELFTLGIGNYSETDVKEGARAFTGWTLDSNREFWLDARAHDNGAKTFMGVQGGLDGNDIVDIIMVQPAHAPFMARKLLRYFVRDTVEEGTVKRFADIYLHSGYSIRELVRQILLSPEFRSEAAYFSLVKSPVEFTVGAMRQLSAHVADLASWKVISWQMNTMGQYLYYPPDVAGWPGGRNWANSSSYLNRANFAARLVAMDGPLTVDPWKMAVAAGVARNPADAVDYFVEAFLAADVTPQYRQTLLDFMRRYPSGRPQDGKFRGVARLILSSPAYQLN